MALQRELDNHIAQLRALSQRVPKEGMQHGGAASLLEAWTATKTGLLNAIGEYPQSAQMVLRSEIETVSAFIAAMGSVPGQPPPQSGQADQHAVIRTHSLDIAQRLLNALADHVKQLPPSVPEGTTTAELATKPREVDRTAIEAQLQAALTETEKAVAAHIYAARINRGAAIAVALAAAVTPVVWAVAAQSSASPWAMVLAWSARLLVVATLAFIAHGFVRAAREETEHAARVRQQAAGLRALATLPFLGEDAGSEAIRALAHEIAQPPPATPKTEGLMLPMSLVEKVPELVQEYLKKK